MNKLTFEDIKPLADYEKVRREFRRRIIDLKKDRRISLGDRVTLVFENRDTLIFQIQEMMHAEHIQEREKIEEELNTYNGLIPGAGELSATLLIEITESEKIREILSGFQGIDRQNSVYLELGSERIPAEFEAGHSKEDKISAVHYVRFRLNSQQQNLFRNLSVPARLIIDHPSYRAQAEVTKTVRASLIQDLETP